MLKKTAVILFVVGLIFGLFSCDKQNAENTALNISDEMNRSDVTDTTDQAVTLDYEDNLSTATFDGYHFRILVRKGQTATQYQEEPQEDIVRDAIYRRNKAVEERFGITITVSESANANSGTDALNSILAGDDAYDLIFAHSRSAFSYAVQGAAYNISEIESIHVDKPWWSKNIKNDCELNGRLYVLDGDISIEGLSNAMCLLFNKKLFDEKGFRYPYESVKDGEWTFDELQYYVKRGGGDLNGDGVILPEDDAFGLVTNEWGYPIAALYTGGQKIYGKNDEGVFELTLNSNKTVAIFDELFRLLNSEDCYTTISGVHPYYYENAFKEGRALFMDGGLGAVKRLRDMDDDFGVLPYPKFDDEDEYATIINGYAPLGIIPITVSDPERTGAITEALAAYGCKYVLPAFYDVSLKTKYSRDEESEKMMDIIKDSIVYDIGYVSEGPFQSIGRELVRFQSQEFSSFYAAREGTARLQVETFNADYGGLN